MLPLVSTVIASLAVADLGGLQAGATSGPTIALSASSGAVGDTVNLSGSVGQGCHASVVWVYFSPSHGKGLDRVKVPVSKSGTWSVHALEIPNFNEGGATFGSSPVDPGAYTFSTLIPTPTGNCAAASAPFEVTGTFATQPSSRFVGMAPTPESNGYWLAQKDGGVFAYGDAGFFGALPRGPGGLGITPAAPISGIAATPDGGGYWLVGEDGGVFAFGDAHFYGSLPQRGIRPYGPIVGIASTPDGGGYWLIGADGGVFAFGNAVYYGPQFPTSASALASTPDGKGYFLLSLEGGLVAEGDATALTAASGTTNHIAGTYTHWFSGMAVTPDGKGVWLVGSDGGVFTHGDAPYLGSLPGEGIMPRAPVVGMARTADGKGYWLVAADGGVFSFGDAGYYGSAGNSGLPW